MRAWLAAAAFGLAGCVAPGLEGERAAGVEIAPWGALKDGRIAQLVTLRNARGMTVQLTNLGAAVTRIEVPDREGMAANVVLALRTLGDYEARLGTDRHGATIGRYAGRIANARFALDGVEYRLKANNGPNTLHGGSGPGFDARLWDVWEEKDGVVFSYTSPEGEQGFPGALTVRVSYRLEPGNTLRIDYSATTTRPTVLNFTNHSYFNLAGEGSGNVLGQRLRLFAKRYAADVGGIPTGEFPSVADTPLDFRDFHAIGERIDVSASMMPERPGYNNSWVLDKPRPGTLAPAAILTDPVSGRTLTVETTEPSITVYTGDYFGGTDIGPSGKAIRPRDGVALEAQHLSDSPNRQEFPTTVLRPGQTYRATTLWRFGIAHR